MSQVIPYLVFSGNCKEAMQFYADCLDGQITMMQTFADSPIEVEAENGERIFNAEIKAQGICIKASDDLPSHPTQVGSNISLFVQYNNEHSQRATFDRLAKGGNVMFPIEGGFGMLRDRYGIQWMIVDESAG